MKQQPKHWESVFRKDPNTGDLILKFPTSFLKQQDWKTGDTLRFEDVKDGSFVLVNDSKNQREKIVHDKGGSPP